MKFGWLRDVEFKTGDEVVYFVQGENGGPIKIGRSKQSLPMRLSQIQCGNPYKLVVRRLVGGNEHTEGELHKHFRRYRLTGEWFSSTPELAELARAKDNDPSEDYRHGYEDGRRDFFRALLRAYGLGHLPAYEYRRQLPNEVIEAVTTLAGQVEGQAKNYFQ